MVTKDFKTVTKFSVIILYLMLYPCISRAQVPPTGVGVSGETLTLDSELDNNTTATASEYILLTDGFWTNTHDFDAIIDPNLPVYRIKYGSNSSKNFVLATSYGDDNQITSQGISYYDYLGRPTQSIGRNLTDDKLVVSQTLYDAQGRGVLQTMAIPITTTKVAAEAMNYIDGFITAHGGIDYNYHDFDGVYTESPVDLDVDCQVMSYYNNSNTEEPFAPHTTKPYTRVRYSQLNPGQVQSSTLAGQHHYLGSGHEPQSYTMVASNDELVGLISVPDATKNEELEYRNLVKTITVDPQGNESIVYTSSSDGKVISQCLSNPVSTPDEKNVVLTLTDENRYIDIHIPFDNQRVDLPLAGSIGVANYYIYDLSTDDLLATYLNCYAGGGTSHTFSKGYYRIAVIPNPAVSLTHNIQFKLNYYDHSLLIYDKAGRQVCSYSPKAVNLIKNGAADKYNLSSHNVYNAEGQLLQTHSPDEGVVNYKYRKDGKLRYSANALQDTTKYSYTNYDDAGRIVQVGEARGDMNSVSVEFNVSSGNYTTNYLYDMPDDTSRNAIVGSGYDEYIQHFVYGQLSKSYNSENTTWYSYTYDGLSEWVIQYNTEGAFTLDYEYSPVSRNLTKVTYQKGTSGEFAHIYIYDADSRLKKVYTNDGSGDQLQAKYIYYQDGVLKRVELGHKLQGIDYVYTINGWLKSINSPTLEQAKDPGQDLVSNNGVNQDVFGMALEYYSGDYTRTGSNINTGMVNNLYNGNISAQRWKIKGQETLASNACRIYDYSYNNKGWLTDAVFGTYISSGSYTPLAANKVYGITYDANGNIKTLNRNKYNGYTMDELSYTYEDGDVSNRLHSVKDDAPMSDPIQLMPGTRYYEYNDIGQLTDITVAEYLHLEYDPYKRVTLIDYGSSGYETYAYDDRGFRSRVTKYTSSDVLDKETAYIRDVAGNIQAIYTKTYGTNHKLEQLPVYGSSRIGIAELDEDGNNIEHYVYELTDHLGNVRVTVQDNYTEGGTLNMYADYFPFGMLMPGRISNYTDYNFGYQGQFSEYDETSGYNHFQLRDYDSRLGRWMIPDPYGQYWSPYLGMGNNSILYIDIDGGLDGWNPRRDARNFANQGIQEGYRHTSFFKTYDGRWIGTRGGFAQDFGSNYFSRVFSKMNGDNWRKYFSPGGTGRYAWETNIQFNLQLGAVGFTFGVSFIEADDGIGGSYNLGWAEGFDVPNIDISRIKHVSTTDEPLTINDLSGHSIDFNESCSILNMSTGGNVPIKKSLYQLSSRYTSTSIGLNLGPNDFACGGTVSHTTTYTSKGAWIMNQKYK